MKLKDKVALITGAGGGIGRESALLFSREGAAVVAVDVNDAAGKETVSLSKSRGPRSLRPCRRLKGGRLRGDGLDGRTSVRYAQHSLQQCGHHAGWR